MFASSGRLADFEKLKNRLSCASKLRSRQKRLIFKNDDVSGRTVPLVSKRSTVTDWLGDWFGPFHAAPLHHTSSASHYICPAKRQGGSVRPGWLTVIFRTKWHHIIIAFWHGGALGAGTRVIYP
jgi:hypothetical protein